MTETRDSATPTVDTEPEGTLDHWRLRGRIDCLRLAREDLRRDDEAAPPDAADVVARAGVYAAFAEGRG